MDEGQLIARSQAGDLAAFNELVAIYQGQVYNLALRMLGAVHTAEDATQEAFINAFRHIRGFRGGSFRSWLLRIATNACYDQLRSSRRSKSLSLEAMLEEDPTSEPPSRMESPEEHALRAELSQVISSAFAALPPDQRAALALSDVEGFSYEEIAKAMGSSLGTVKSRLSRARARVRAYLSERRELLPARYRQQL